MSSPLGFVVLARRPGQPDEPVSAVFPAYPNGLEQAENVLEGFENEKRIRCFLAPVPEYVIGEISERTPLECPDHQVSFPAQGFCPRCFPEG